MMSSFFFFSASWAAMASWVWARALVVSRRSPPLLAVLKKSVLAADVAAAAAGGGGLERVRWEREVLGF